MATAAAPSPTLLGTAVEELLRFESPLQLNNRLSTAPLRIGDVELPAGSFITLAIGSANRDPTQFHEPDRLDVGRKPNPHLAFGQGASRLRRHERGAAGSAHRLRPADGALPRLCGCAARRSATRASASAAGARCRWHCRHG